MKRIVVDFDAAIKYPDWWPTPDPSTEIHGPHLPAHKTGPSFRHFVKPNAWTFLHSYRGCDPAWLKKWEGIIPRGRCDCKTGYLEILKDYPPDFSSPEAFFSWGVELHNAVNRKLGKPEMTLDEARKLWRGDDGLDAESKQ